jgi:hypothetical protein
MTLCIKDLYLIFLTIIIIYLLYCNVCNKEKFDITTADIPTIKTLINQVYQADIEAVRNLSSIATKITSTGGLIVPGDLKVATKLATNNLDPNNMPAGWGGGLRTWDIYAGGTIGLGRDGKEIKASMDCNGNALVSGTLTTGTINNSGTLTTNGIVNTGNLSISGNLLLNTFYMKYSQAGIYQIKAAGRMVPLYYGWTILFPASTETHAIASRLQLYEISSMRNGTVQNSICDTREWSDDNYRPLKLVVFPGYCVRFYYWTIESKNNMLDPTSINNVSTNTLSSTQIISDSDAFNSGEYNWYNVKHRTKEPVHLIHVTLASEGISNFDRLKQINSDNFLTGKKLYDYNWETSTFPTKLPNNNINIDKTGIYSYV